MSKDKLLLMVPTKGRPDKYKILEDSYQSNHGDASMLMPIIDLDEKEMYEPSKYDVQRIYFSGNLVDKLNYGAEVALSLGYKYIGWVGDDVVIQTPDFDLAIIAAFEADPAIKIIHCADMLHNGAIANHWIVRAELVKALHYFIPPEFKHLYIDNFWTKVGAETNTIKYLPHVILEHRHWINQKAQNDATYQLAEANDGMEHGRKVFENLTTGQNWFNFLEKYNNV
jgi:hypothetical protein